MTAAEPILSVPPSGYWLREAAADARSSAVHYLGGEQYFEVDDCPNCHKPLLLLLDLDLADTRLELSTTGLSRLPSLYCWTCAAVTSQIRYRVKSFDNRVRIINFPVGESYRDFPYADYPKAFARRLVDLIPLTSEEQQVLNLLNHTTNRHEIFERYPALDRPRHQVGGEPLLMQRLDDVVCSRCQEAMPLFASIGNDTFGPQTFSGNDWAQVLFHVCRACRELVAYSASD